jgi:hypothetical protein
MYTRIKFPKSLKRNAQAEAVEEGELVASARTDSEDDDLLISRVQSKKPRVETADLSCSIPELPVVVPSSSYSNSSSSASSASSSRSIKLVKKIYREPVLSTKTVFEMFTQGDIIFGLLDEREKVTKVLKTSGYHNIVANDLNNPAVNLIVENKHTALKKDVDPHMIQHQRMLMDHRAYLIKPKGKPIPTIPDSPIVSSAYRRGCKLLLINREKERVSNVHIITKGIDWKRLCHKVNPATKQVCEAITGSEIRAIYRDEKKFGVHPMIFFYDENHLVMQTRPWNTLAIGHHFQHYDQQRRIKKSK